MVLYLSFDYINKRKGKNVCKKIGVNVPREKRAAMIHNYQRYGKRERLSLFHGAELSDVPVRVHVRDPRLQHLLLIYLPLSEVPEIAPERFRIQRRRVAVKRQHLSYVLRMFYFLCRKICINVCNNVYIVVTFSRLGINRVNGCQSCSWTAEQGK